MRRRKSDSSENETCGDLLSGAGAIKGKPIPAAMRIIELYPLEASTIYASYSELANA